MKKEELIRLSNKLHLKTIRSHRAMIAKLNDPAHIQYIAERLIMLIGIRKYLENNKIPENKTDKIINKQNYLLEEIENFLEKEVA